MPIFLTKWTAFCVLTALRSSALAPLAMPTLRAAPVRRKFCRIRYIDGLCSILYSFFTMQRKISKICFFIFLALSFLSAVSCVRSNSVASINEKDLFTINYGSFEDELNLFNSSTSGSINTFMTMHDGFFMLQTASQKKSSSLIPMASF